MSTGAAEEAAVIKGIVKGFKPQPPDLPTPTVGAASASNTYSSTVSTSISALSELVFSPPENVVPIPISGQGVDAYSCECPEPVDAISLDDAPTFSDSDISIRDISKPSALNSSAPIAPSVSERSYPDSPAKIIPKAPSLQELTLPATPTLKDIQFDDLSDITLDNPPDGSFDYSEKEYSSSLLVALNDKLISYVEGFSTGLNENLEKRIWQAGADREECISKGLISSVDRHWLSSGWEASEVDKKNEANQRSNANKLSNARDVDINKAYLEQENFKAAFINAIQLESRLLTQASQIKQRELDAAIYETQVYIDIYNLKIVSFDALVNAYEIKGKVFSARIAAELAKIEISRSYLQSQALINDINTKDIEIYSQRIDAVVALFGLYKSEIIATSSKISGEKIKLDLFAEEIRAYDYQVSAKDVEYEGYEAEVSGELTKVKMNDEMATVFKNKVDSYKTLVDSKVIEKDVELKINQEMPLKSLEANTAILSSASAIESSLIGAQIDLTGSNVKAFVSNIKGDAVISSAEIDSLILDLDKTAVELAAKGESIRLSIATINANKNNRSKAIAANSRVTSQLVAAMGGVESHSYSTSTSYSDNTSGGISNSGSLSCSTSNSSSDSTTWIFNED